MDVSNLPALPLTVAAVVATAAALVSGFFLLFAAPIARLPGFGPNDETRDAFLRLGHGLLTLLLTVAMAWSQNVVIQRGYIPALLLAVAIASGALNGIYIGAKALAAPSSAATPAALAPAQNIAASAPFTTLAVSTSAPVAPAQPAILATESPDSAL